MCAPPEVEELLEIYLQSSPVPFGCIVQLLKFQLPSKSINIVDILAGKAKLLVGNGAESSEVRS